MYTASDFAGFGQLVRDGVAGLVVVRVGGDQ